MVAVFLGTLLIGLMYLCFDSTEPGTLPTLFPTRVRAGALSITYNISTSLFGGTTPLIAAALVDSTHSLIAPGFMLVAAGAAIQRLRDHLAEVFTHGTGLETPRLAAGNQRGEPVDVGHGDGPGRCSVDPMTTITTARVVA